MDNLALAWDEEDDDQPLEVVGRVDSPEKADRYLYVIAELESEVRENNRIADQQIAKIQYWLDTENRKRETRILWLAGALENFARQVDKKTISLPNGWLKLRVQQPSLDVDEETFFASNPPEELVRIIPEKKAPDKKAIREHIKSTGEIPEGCEWTEAGGPAFSWEVAWGAERKE